MWHCGPLDDGRGSDLPGESGHIDWGRLAVRSPPMAHFSHYAGSLPESQTLAITAAAKRLKAQGVEVAPFGAGEPDFDTPDHVKAAAADAIAAGRTKYGPAAGIGPLREAVAEHFDALGYRGVTADRTVISAGAKGVLHLALMVLLREDDEVLVPTPCWLSYGNMIQAASGRPIWVETRPEDGFAIDPDRVRAAITDRTRAIILNSPGNPTGAVQSDEVQAELGRIAVEHDLFVISDEIYEHLVYEPARFKSFAELAPDAHDHTLIVNGVSKAYAMTGWRIGYAAGPAEWIQRMIRLQSHALSGPCEINQVAALAALTGPQVLVEERRLAFLRRRDAIVAALRTIDGWTVNVPEGAFYVLPDVSAHLGKRFGDQPIDDTTALATLLLQEAHAAVVPGGVFEAPYALRFSYACSTDDIERGIERIRGVLAQLN